MSTTVNDTFLRPFVPHGKLIEIVVASVWIHSINQCRLHFVDNLGKKKKSCHDEFLITKPFFVV